MKTGGSFYDTNGQADRSNIERQKVKSCQVTCQVTSCQVIGHFMPGHLSPTLFSVFLNDLATEIKNLNAGVDTSDGTVGILLYADDIALIAPSEKNLQKMLDTLFAWTDIWLMNIHPDKSQIVHFRKNDVDETKHCFKCGPINLKTVSFYKYLGVIFSEHLDY